MESVAPLNLKLMRVLRLRRTDVGVRVLLGSDGEAHTSR